MSKRKRKTKTRREQPRSIYEPLPPGRYIRVLVLYPGDYDDDIRCELKILSHKRSSDRYAAISYVWGDPHETVEITCNNLVTSITVSLADALRQFRHPKTIRRLWADALCINQDDFEAKGHQVSHMGTVYANAARVLVWLGLDVEGTAHEVFCTIEHITAYFDEQFEKVGRDYYRMPRLQKSSPVPMDRAIWLKIQKLTKSSWFKRAWTIQECAVAKICHVYWGSSRIDIADLVEFSHWCSMHHDLRLLSVKFELHSINVPDTLFRNFYRYYKSDRTWKDTRSGLDTLGHWNSQLLFSTLLRATNWLEASNARDYVYAFLGCPSARNAEGHPMLEVSYSQSVAEVGWETASVLLRLPTEGPWVLSCVEYRDRSQMLALWWDELSPTWVPRWGSFKVPSAFSIANPHCHFEAGGPIERFSPHFEGTQVLRIGGFIFDTIAWRSEEVWPGDLWLLPEAWSDKTKAMNESVVDSLWRELYEAADGLHLSLDDEAFAATLLLGDGNNTHAAFEDYRELVRSVVPGFASSSQQKTPEKNMRLITGLVAQVILSLGYKCLILTHSGRVGLASRASEVGDLCCIFLGAAAPFILAQAEYGRCRLVGESYIHGVMGGELVDQYEPRSIILI